MMGIWEFVILLSNFKAADILISVLFKKKKKLQAGKNVLGTPASMRLTT